MISTISFPIFFKHNLIMKRIHKIYFTVALLCGISIFFILRNSPDRSFQITFKKWPMGRVDGSWRLVGIDHNAKTVTVQRGKNERIALFFGHKQANEISKNSRYTTYAVPECEWNITRWPITVTLLLWSNHQSGQNVLEKVGTYTYPALYPDIESDKTPEVNIAITRRHKATPAWEYSMRRMMELLDGTWRFQIFASLDMSIEAMKFDFYRDAVESGRLEVTILEDMSYFAFTRDMIMIEFWKQVHGDNILMFHPDSCLCSHPSKPLSYFMQFDYLTSPWGTTWKGFEKYTRGGNDGFSFRKRKFVLDILSWNDTILTNARGCAPGQERPDGKGKCDDAIFCDLVYGSLLQDHPDKFNIPDTYTLSQFSVQMVPYPSPLAVHVAWVWISQENYSDIAKNCPEVVRMCQLSEKFQSPFNCKVKKEA